MKTTRMLAALVLLVGICMTCVSCSIGGPGTAASTAPATSPKRPDPGVTTAELGAAMAAAKSLGGDPRRVEVLNFALKELGKRCKLGGNGPDVWDCSGLVKHCYAEVGVKLPRVTYDQVKEGKEIKRKDLLTGDLLFYFRNGHVGLYIGKGLMIHAFGKVKVEKFSKYSHSLSAVRRVLLQPVRGGTGSSMRSAAPYGLLTSGIGHIFFDGEPYVDLSGGDFGLPFFWTYLIDLGLFLVVAALVFLAAKEVEPLKRMKSTVPYWLITVTLGIPIDVLFLFLVGKLYFPYGWTELLKDLRYGYALQGSPVNLVIPTVIALALLFLVQVVMFRIFFDDVETRKMWYMCGAIAFMTLPTWGTLILIATHHGMRA